MLPGVQFLMAAYMHLDDGPCISLPLVTPPCDALVLTGALAGADDQDDAAGTTLYRHFCVLSLQVFWKITLRETVLRWSN